MALLEILEILLMMLDGGLELLDVLGATLTEGRLCLTVTLFAFFRRGINLARGDQSPAMVCHDGEGSSSLVYDLLSFWEQAPGPGLPGPRRRLDGHQSRHPRLNQMSSRRC